MELSIKILLNDSCKVIVLDTSEYLSEDSTNTAKGLFKLSDVVFIDVLLRNKTTEVVYLNPVYSIENLSVEIPVTFDGWFTINHIVLPSKTWFETELAKSTGSAIGLYEIVYYSDGESIYKYYNETLTEVTIDEILEVNSDVTTISTTSKDYVSICNLRKCYINLCKQIFNDRAFSSCWNNDSIDSELTFKRDLVLMILNVVKYLVLCNLLAEAERLIEIAESCNGLCSNYSDYACGCISNKINITGNGCGCK